MFIVKSVLLFLVSISSVESFATGINSSTSSYVVKCLARDIRGNSRGSKGILLATYKYKEDAGQKSPWNISFTGRECLIKDSCDFHLIENHEDWLYGYNSENPLSFYGPIFPVGFKNYIYRGLYFMNDWTEYGSSIYTVSIRMLENTEGALLYKIAASEKSSGDSLGELLQCTGYLIDGEPPF